MNRSFIDALPQEIASIVVHCEGGYSRSCAVALARLIGLPVLCGGPPVVVLLAVNIYGSTESDFE